MKKPQDPLMEDLKALLIERSVDTSREFTLASGRKSNFYFDARKTTLSARGQNLIGQIGHAFIWNTVGIAPGVGGLEVGSIPIATAIAQHSNFGGGLMDAFYVRKAAKAHGTGKIVEGVDHIPKGSKLIVVEDVTTTGGSALKAVKAVREAGYVCEAVFTLVDREEGGRENIEAEGCTLYSFFDRSDLLGG
jgi:orotate phosphoribosyltransferase